jgi:peptide/nickel transport system substrate-binding protein
MNKLAIIRGVLLAVMLVVGSFALAQGGDLVIAMNGASEPANLDSQLDPFDSAKVLNNFVADRLVFINPDGARIEPHLATGWEISDDNLTWTFTLREGVKFQDDTPFNAEAVKANFDRIMSPETGSGEAADALGPIASVDVIDEFTISVTHERPWNSFLFALANQGVMWSPTALAENSPGEFSKLLIGTGPFKLVEAVPNSHVRFERWDEYNWGPSIKQDPGPVALDSVTVKFIDEELVRGTIITTDEANVVWDLPAQFVADYEGNSDFQLISGFQAGTGMQYVMNVTKPPLDSLLVRRAIRHATNQQGLNNLVYDGRNLVMNTPLNSVHPCYAPELESVYPYDLERAGELLAEAGYEDRDGDGIVEAYGVAGVEDGSPLVVRWTALSRQAKGEALQAQLRQAGIDLQLEIIPGPVQLERAQKKDFDLIYERQRIALPAVLHIVWFSENDGPGQWAWTGFQDDGLDGLLDQMINSLEPSEACDLARQAQHIIQDNALQLPTLSEAVFYVLENNIQGFELGSQGLWFYVYNTRVEE